MIKFKEQLEYLDSNKDTEEIIQILASCSYNIGERYGNVRGQSFGWSRVVSLLTPMFKNKEISEQLYLKCCDEFLESTKKADTTPNPEIESMMKDTKIVQKACWSILKKRKVI